MKTHSVLDKSIPSDRLTVQDNKKAKTPFTLEVTVEKIRHFLEATKLEGGLVLLEKAINKSKVDESYALRMENALLHGSTVEFRELFSDFGCYWARTSDVCPYYPHGDAVDSIDSAMLSIRLGDEKEAIEDYNFLHNRKK